MVRFPRFSNILRGRHSKPVILMYHRISTASFDPWELAVSPAIFQKQMLDLAKTRKVMPLSEFAASLLKGTLSHDAAAITFDDGYACNALIAAPFLEALGLPATFFLITSMLGKCNEFWNDALERVIFDPKAGGTASVDLGGRQLNIDLGAPVQFAPANRRWRALKEPPQSAREQSYLELWKALKPAPFDLQYAVIETIARKLGSDLNPRLSYRPMTITEAKTLAQRSGLEIAGHTETHISLPLWDRNVQLREIKESRRICEDLSSRLCMSFAYPYGDFSELTLDCASESRLTYAVSARPRPVAITDVPLALPRIMMTNDSIVASAGLD